MNSLILDLITAVYLSGWTFAAIAMFIYAIAERNDIRRLESEISRLKRTIKGLEEKKI